MGQAGHAQRVSADDPALGTAVVRAQDGDEAAFAALYRLVQPGLLGYVRGIVGEGAEDIAAASWREIARELPRFRGDGHGFRGWTASIARHHALGHFRPRRASSGSSGSPWTPPTVDRIDHTLPGATLSAETTQALVVRLPRAQAEAVLLRHVVRLGRAHSRPGDGQAPRRRTHSGPPRSDESGPSARP